MCLYKQGDNFMGTEKLAVSGYNFLVKQGSKLARSSLLTKTSQEIKTIKGLKYSHSLPADVFITGNTKLNLAQETRSVGTVQKGTFFSRLFSKKKSAIEPKVFQHDTSPSIRPWDEPVQSRYMKWEDYWLKNSSGVEVMKRGTLPKKQKIININNIVYPRGSISASTTLDECIVTSKMLQCAGVSIVDKKNNIQTLLHCFPGDTEKDMENLIRHAMSKNNKNLDVAIIHGIDPRTDSTIISLKKVFKNLLPDNRIKLLEFPKEIDPLDRGIMLLNGEITACTGSEILLAKNKVTNPKNMVSYIKNYYNTKEKTNFLQKLKFDTGWF